MIVDELEMRRQQLADPEKAIKQLQAKTRLSRKEKQRLKTMQNFEAQLKSAVDLRVPQNLPEQILLRSRLHHQSHLRSKLKPLFTMAASVLVVTLVLLRFYVFTPSTALANSAIQHLYSEMDHMEQVQTDAKKRLQDALKMMGIDKKITIKHLRNVSNCMVGKNPGIHLVMEMENEIYTVLILPEVNSEKFTSFNDQHIHGEIIPSKTGTIIVMSMAKVPLGPLIKEMKQKFS